MPDYEWIVFVHEQGSFWTATFTDPGISINYTTAQVQIHYEDVLRLPTEENQCSETSQDECLESYITNALKTTTNCRPHWIDLALPFCKTMQTFNISHELVMSNFKKMNTICKKSCNFLNIRTGGRNSKKEKKYSKLYLYFPYKVPVEQENYLFTGLTLIAEIGGSGGLFLGICFYDFYELIMLALKWKLVRGHHA